MNGQHRLLEPARQPAPRAHPDVGRAAVLELAGVGLRGGRAAVEVDAVLAEARRLRLDRDEDLRQRHQGGRRPAQGDDPVRVVVAGLGGVVAPQEGLDRVAERGHRPARAGAARGGLLEGLAAHQRPPRLRRRLVVDPLEPEPQQLRSGGEPGQVHPEQHDVGPGDGMHRELALLDADPHGRDLPTGPGRNGPRGATVSPSPADPGPQHGHHGTRIQALVDARRQPSASSARDIASA